MQRFFILAALFILIGCGGGSDNTKKLKKLPQKLSWQWQLQGKVETNYNASLYDIDLFDTPKETIKQLRNKGVTVICYFSAGSWEDWRKDSNSFPKEAIGNSLEEWEGEKWLDIRNSKVRNIMIKRIQLAKEKGCDGIEPDNVDGYINDTGFNLSYKDQINYNLFLAENAKKLNLLIGLKNDLEQIKELEPHFDFALNEQCHQFEECYYLQPFIDAQKPVLNAEYAKKYVENISGARDKLCQQAKKEKINTLILPKELDGSFRIECN